MPFSFLFDELMKGGGVGFSVARSNISQIPRVDFAIDLQVVVDESSESYDASVKVGAVGKNELVQDADSIYYRLPDTREAGFWPMPS